MKLLSALKSSLIPPPHRIHCWKDFSVCVCVGNEWSGSVVVVFYKSIVCKYTHIVYSLNVQSILCLELGGFQIIALITIGRTRTTFSFLCWSPLLFGPPTKQIDKMSWIFYMSLHCDRKLVWIWLYSDDGLLKGSLLMSFGLMTGKYSRFFLDANPSQTTKPASSSPHLVAGANQWSWLNLCGAENVAMEMWAAYSSNQHTHTHTQPVIIRQMYDDFSCGRWNLSFFPYAGWLWGGNG